MLTTILIYNQWFYRECMKQLLSIDSISLVSSELCCCWYME